MLFSHTAPSNRVKRRIAAAQVCALLLGAASLDLSAQLSSELTVWTATEQAAAACNCCEPYQEFADAYPDSAWYSLAKQRAGGCKAKAPQEPTVEQKLWVWAEMEDSCDAYRRYLGDFPNGQRAADAQSRADDRCASPPPLAPAPKPPPSPTTATPTRSVPRSVPVATQTPEQFAEAYYDALDDADARRAVAMWAASTPKAKLRKIGEDVANNAEFNLESRRTVGPVTNRALVDVQVSGRNKGDSASGHWRLRLHLVREGTNWKLERMTLP